jgi:K+-sensing histidine kinase KdpD
MLLHLPGPEGPWFLTRPRLAAGLAAAMFAAVFVMRLVVRDPQEGACLFYVLPIALVAFAFGRLAGALAGVLGIALFGVWVLLEGASFGVIGWLSRIVPMLLLGLLVGGAADQQRRAAAAERSLLVAQLRARRAAELTDSVIQGLSAAKWAAESGNHVRTLDVLSETVESAQPIVSDLLEDRVVRAPEVRLPSQPG